MPDLFSKKLIHIDKLSFENQLFIKTDKIYIYISIFSDIVIFNIVLKKFYVSIK